MEEGKEGKKHRKTLKSKGGHRKEESKVGNWMEGRKTLKRVRAM